MTLTPEKRLRTTIGSAALVIGAVISLTWGASTYLNKIDSAQAKTDARIEKMEQFISSQIEALRMEIAENNKKVWLADQQYRWAGQLRWEFRKSEFNIPEPRDFRATP